MMSAFKQARNVDVWIAKELDHSMAWVALQNESSALIYKAILSVVNGSDNLSSGLQTPLEYRTFIGTIPLGRSYIKILIHHGMSFQSELEIAFMDRDGNSWLRLSSGKVVSLATQPFKYYGLNL